MKAFEKKQSEYLNKELNEEEKSVLRGYLNADPNRTNTFFQIVQNYSRGYINDLDEQLLYYRDTKGHMNIKSETDLKRAIEIFDGIFEKAPPLPKNTIVYRTKLYSLFLNEGYFKLKPGKILTDKGYLSTTSESVDASVLESYGVSDTALVAGEDQKKKFEREGKYIKSIRERPKQFEKGPKLYIADLTNPCCVMKIHVPKGTHLLMAYLFEENDNKNEKEFLFPRGTRLRFNKHSVHNGIGTFEFDMLYRSENKRKRTSSSSGSRKKIRTEQVRWNDYTLKQLKDFARMTDFHGYSVNKSELVKRLKKAGVRVYDLQRLM